MIPMHPEQEAASRSEIRSAGRSLGQSIGMSSSENQGTLQYQSQWKGFLPENAIIMARRVKAPVKPEGGHSPEAETQTVRGLSIEVQPEARTGVSPELPPEFSNKEREGRPPEIIEKGNSAARLLLVGEAFGVSSQPEINSLLEKMIQALGLELTEVMSLGLVGFEKDAKAAADLMRRTLSKYTPEVILTFGALSTHFLLENKEEFTQVRGRTYRFGSLKVIPTWHPRDLLQVAHLKREAWSDLKKAASELGLSVSSKR